MGEDEGFFFYRAKLLRVVDGDTLDVMVDLGFSVFKKIRVRLLGVDAPEVYGKKDSPDELVRGQAATKFVIDLLPAVLKIRTYKDSRGKYGRWLANVLFFSDGVEEEIDLSEALVEAGHAVRKEY